MFDGNWGSDFNTVPRLILPLQYKEEPVKPKVCKPETPGERLRRLHWARVAAHPDRGGSHEAFIRANAAYEAAKAITSSGGRPGAAWPRGS